MAFLLRRLWWSRTILACILLLLIMRIGYLMIYMGEALTESSVRSHMIRLSTVCERGDIYDRNGVCITNQGETCYAAVFPAVITDTDSAMKYLVNISGRKQETINKLYQLRKPFCLELNKKTELGSIMDGIFVFAQKSRYDPAMMASHVIGYVKDGNRVGVGGVEAICNNMLTNDSYQQLQILTDGAGHLIRGAPYRLSSQPNTEKLSVTLDWKIQQEIETIFDKRHLKGSAVVMNTDGEILAMVSRPTFCIGKISEELSRKDAPFLNRAVQPAALGSVFKVVTALAALESGTITSADIWEDAGRIEIAGITFRGWDDSQDYVSRRLTLAEAMAHSSNSVFIQIGTKTGAEKIVEMAKRLGYGDVTMENYTEEQAGNLPVGKNLYIAETANLAIGQGKLLATPMQVTKMMSIIANGGYNVSPRLIKKSAIHDRTRIVDAGSICEVQNMLAAAVDNGTGSAAQSVRGQVCGKTGSAETGRMTADDKSINHAWFSGYFPRESPQYVCTIMIEDGMSGGKVAAPIFREIMEIIHQKNRLYPSQK